MSDRALSVLVHGASKAGKTTFAVTSPYPRLLLDVESASRFLNVSKVIWDPMRQAPPVADGSWDTCVVYVRDYETVKKAYEWLQTGQHQFRSVIIDSISELQVRCAEQIAGRGQMQTQHWGELLRDMAGLCRDLRDLTMHETNPLEAVVLTSMTRNQDRVWKPYLQGQLGVVIPYFWDITAYLYVDHVQDDPTQPPVEVRRLLTRKHPEYEAGERVGGRLPAVVDNPNIDEMITAIFGPRPEVAPPADEAQAS